MENIRKGNNLITNKEIKTLDSREVAQMLEINHWEILRKLEGTDKIKGIIPTLTNNKIVVSDYFIKSSYKDLSGKENRCYLFTKMGCEFIANKFTGEKGILFTAKYVERFNQMEQVIEKPKTAFDLLELQFAALKEVKNQLDQVADKTTKNIKAFEEFKEDSPLFNIECEELQNAVRRKGVKVLGGKNSKAYKDRSLRARVYKDIHREFQRHFGINSYKAIKRKHFEMAKDLVDFYEVPIILKDEIKVLNNQMCVEV